MIFILSVNLQKKPDKFLTACAQDLVKRTPSTSAIYETLRRSNDHIFTSSSLSSLWSDWLSSSHGQCSGQRSCGNHCRGQARDFPVRMGWKRWEKIWWGRIINIAIIGDNDDRTNHNISIRNILMFEGNIMLVLVLVPMCNCHYWSMVMFPTLNLLTNQDGFRDWGFWNLS